MIFITRVHQLLFFSAISFAAKAQQSYPSSMQQGPDIKYESCWLNFDTSGVAFARLATDSLNDFFHNSLPNKSLQKIKGTLLVNVIVNGTGTACCLSIRNFTSTAETQIRALAIDQIIANGKCQLFANGKWQSFPLPQPNSKTQVADCGFMLEFKCEGQDGYVINYFRPVFEVKSPRVFQLK